MIYITTYPLPQRINPMRKLLLTTAAVAAAIAGAVAAEPSFGTFTDTRDGQTYKTVKIGKQTWMAQNINYQTKNGSWCYENNESNCKKYGRLYDWKTAKTVCPAGWKLSDADDWNVLVVMVGGGRVVAPAGGRHETAGKILKSKSGWGDFKVKRNNDTDDDDVLSVLFGSRRDANDNDNGTDDFGFSALPGGSRDPNGGFIDIGGFGIWWTATENFIGNLSQNAFRRIINYSDDVVDEGDRNKSHGFSVRCVADRP
jgi:uncharacterized protein (TIGR02145 family)